MNVARDARSLIGDRAAELRLADRTPDPDEQHAIGDDAEKVALQHEVARHHRREHEMEIGEHGERRRQAHPAVQVAPVPAVPQRESDERHDPERREQECRDPDVRPLDAVRLEESPIRRVHRSSGDDEEDGDTDPDRDERSPPGGHPPVDVRSDGDETGSQKTCARELPGGRRGKRSAVEDGNEAERHGSEGDAPEAGSEQEVERATVHEEADAREHAHEGRDDGDGGVEGESRVVELICGLQRVARREQGRPGCEQADEQDLAEEPRAIGLGPRVVHR